MSCFGEEKRLNLEEKIQHFLPRHLEGIQIYIVSFYVPLLQDTAFVLLEIKIIVTTGFEQQWKTTQSFRMSLRLGT